MNYQKTVKILYLNWKGTLRTRIIEPIDIEFKSTEWHPEKQWILNAVDTEKGEVRGFALNGIKRWEKYDIQEESENK